MQRTVVIAVVNRDVVAAKPGETSPRFETAEQFHSPKQEAVSINDGPQVIALVV
jgi:hypothetical protein